MSYKKIVSLPYKIKKGKRQTQSFYIQNGDFSKLKKIITKEIVSNNLSSTHQHPTKTYTDLLLQWLQSKRITVKVSTYSRYYSIVTTYLHPALGSLFLSQLTTQIIENYIYNLLISGRKSNQKGLSPKTVSDILIIIKNSVEYGKNNGLDIPCNIKQISIKKQDKEMRVLNVEEQSLLTNYLCQNTNLYKLGILLSLYTGIRIGELCALKWADLQLPAGIIKISKTLQRIPTIDEPTKTKIIITAPKSAHSVRTIPLPDCIVPIVTLFQNDPQAYVLTGETNRYAEPRIIQYHFQKYIKDIGLPPINYHTLRHTFATRCVELGFDIKSLSEILGHANVNITLNRYVHASFELKCLNMKKLTF